MRQTLDEETGDFACSFWNLLQLAHWIECYGRICNQDPDEFVRFLDKNLDMRTHTYDLSKVRATECTVDRVESLESIRYHGLLFLQYLAQYSDLHFIANRMDPAPDMRDLLRNKNDCMRMLQRKLLRGVFDDYVLAGDPKSLEHYERLRQQYEQTPPQLRQKFMEELPAVDLVRFGILKLQKGMTSQASKDILGFQAMKYDKYRHAPQSYEKRRDEEICTFTVMFDTISNLVMGLKNLSHAQAKAGEADSGIVVDLDADEGGGDGATGIDVGGGDGATGIDVGGGDGGIVVDLDADEGRGDGATVIDVESHKDGGAKQASTHVKVDLSDAP